MTGITIASAYGAGGEEIADRVAEELGFKVLGRAINAKVAAELNLAEDEVASGQHRLTFGQRLGRAFLPAAQNVLGNDAGTIGDSTELRIAAEKVMEEALADGGTVILGRAGAVALQHRPDVFRVRVYGEIEERIAFAVEHYDNVDEATARKDLMESDRARIRYWQHMYGLEFHPSDQRWYQLQLHTSQLGLDTCVRLIVDAYTVLFSGDGTSSTAQG